MFKLEFETDNAAFDDAPADEVANILREIASRIESVGGRFYTQKVHDSYGNAVGTVVFDAGGRGVTRFLRSNRYIAEEQPS